MDKKKKRSVSPKKKAAGQATEHFLQSCRDAEEAYVWLRAGVELALSFGEDWLQPIQGRLAALFPHLSVAQLDAIEAACQEVKQYSESWLQKEAGKHSEEVYDTAWHQTMCAHFPWLDERNLARLFSQGVYYARK